MMDDGQEDAESYPVRERFNEPVYRGAQPRYSRGASPAADMSALTLSRTGALMVPPRFDPFEVPIQLIYKFPRIEDRNVRL